MRKTETVAMDLEQVVCDLCGRDASESPRACEACGRDVCRICRNFMEVHPITQHREWTDYAMILCMQCKPLTGEFEQRAIDVHVQYQAELEQIEREWRAKCKEAVK